MATEFRYPDFKNRRPQILLFGNGLEYSSNQPSWDQFLVDISAPGCADVSDADKKKLPMPLLYELLATPLPAPAHFEEQAKKEEKKRLLEALGKLTNESNHLLDRIPAMEFDHIFTTNYSYCIESAFTKGAIDFSKKKPLQKYRFNANQRTDKNGRQTSETLYKLHAGYAFTGPTGYPTHIWHIHGERDITGSVILGHDKYGSLLSHIESVCSLEAVSHKDEKNDTFYSWPDLFIFGDVYVIGFGMEYCESDLMWLLRRRQQTPFSTGTVYFYEMESDENRIKQLLLKANGVEVLSLGCKAAETDFDTFYARAFDDVSKRMKAHRNQQL